MINMSFSVKLGDNQSLICGWKTSIVPVQGTSFVWKMYSEDQTVHERDQVSKLKLGTELPASNTSCRGSFSKYTDLKFIISQKRFELLLEFLANLVKIRFRIFTEFIKMYLLSGKQLKIYSCASILHVI